MIVQEERHSHFLQQIVKVKFSDKFHCIADQQNTI